MTRKATENDLRVLAELACRLWPEHSTAEMQAEFAELIPKEDAALFVACEREIAIGFAQCQLRSDYVEGTDSSPVGYLEGIYVVEEYRQKGIARELLAACEKWAKEKDCVEFASDCELDNMQSLQFHRKVGFKEVNRIICFAKRI